MVHSDEVYNIYYNISKTRYQEHTDQYESVKIWLDKLISKGYNTLLSDMFYRHFTFAFLSSNQRQLLLNAKSWCLDATHNTTNIENGLLYTIVVRHPVTGMGYPVAYLFTKDGSSAPLIRFLLFLRDTANIPAPTKITIDVSNIELDALTHVYPEAQIQWCCFHVSRAWVKKLRSTVKLGSTSESESLRRRMICDLKSLMWERSKPEFTQKLS